MIYLDVARQEVETHIMHFAESVGSDVRIKKHALIALAAVSGLFALGILSITFVGVIYPTVSFLSVPFLCFSWVTYQMADLLKNYDDPFELQIMKAEARRMSFSELVREHQGIDPLYKYKIVSPLALRSKFLSEYEGRSLSAIFRHTSFSYVQKYELMTIEQIRKFFIAELQDEISITNLCDRFGEFGLRELKRAKVISPTEYEALERIHAEEEKIESQQSSRLLQLETQYFARRENLIQDLLRREKERTEELHKAHAEEREIDLTTLHRLQKQLSAIQSEKKRIEQDESLGKALQSEYEIRKDEIYQEYCKNAEKLLQDLKEMKSQF